MAFAAAAADSAQICKQEVGTQTSKHICNKSMHPPHNGLYYRNIMIVK